MNLTIIQKSIDYIEDNLKTDITAKELSEIHEYEAKGDDIDNQIKCNFLKKREKTS